MDQLQELLEILKSTPEMALWGLLIWCLYILAKLASVVFALKVVAQNFIRRYFDFKEKSLNNKRGVEIAEMFEKQKITGVDYNLLRDLLQAVKTNTNYLHEGDLRRAIQKLNEKN